MITHKDLERFGLSEKEGKVYLACLELGPSTAAQIAQKAGVNRATTYVAIEALTKLGLLSSHEKDHKTLFAAEDPVALKRLLEQQREDVKNRLSSLEGLLPELVTAYNYAGEKPKVRFFEGKEGLISIRDDYYRAKNKNVLGFFAIDAERNVFSVKEREEAFKERKKKGVRLKILYTHEGGPIQHDPKFTNSRFIPQEKFPINSTIVIYDNKVGIVSLKGKLVGVIVDNEQIANTLRSIFNLAWEVAEKYQKK